MDATRIELNLLFSFFWYRYEEAVGITFKVGHSWLQLSQQNIYMPNMGSDMLE